MFIAGLLITYMTKHFLTNMIPNAIFTFFMLNKAKILEACLKHFARYSRNCQKTKVSCYFFSECVYKYKCHRRTFEIKRISVNGSENSSYRYC